MADKSIGFIETFGLAACVAAADAAVKSANVKLLGYEYAKGDGMCTVKVEGNVGACKAAIEAGKKAAEMVNGSLSGPKSVLLKARPADGLTELMVNNRETVGGEIALAEGYRPKGDTKKAVLVKNWKPKEEPKAETPMEEAPEPPVVEELKEETSETEKKTEITEPETKVEEEVKAEPEEEKPEAETEVKPEASAEEEAKVEAEPVEEESVVAPETEDVPVAAPEETTTETAETPKADVPKKKTSTGNRRSGRSRKKKTPDKTPDKE